MGEGGGKKNTKTVYFEKWQEKRNGRGILIKGGTALEGRIGVTLHHKTAWKATKKEK